MKDEKLLTSFIISSAIALFFYMAWRSPDSFGDSFLWNLIEVPIMLFGSFLMVGIATLIPGILIYIFSNKLDHMHEEGRHTSAKILSILVCVLTVIAFALMIHLRQQGA